MKVQRALQEIPFKSEPGATVRRVNAELAARRARLRAGLGAVVRTLAGIALSGAVSAGLWQGFRFATTAPLFAVREIRFSGLAHAAEEELLRRSGLALGQNLFHADLARAARSIEAHPWVASARLERRLPATVIASVVEHRPRALVQLDKLYILDTEGQLFKRAAPDDGLDLPLITGLLRGEWIDRRPESAVRLLLVLQLFDAWTAAGLQPGSLSEVRLDEDSGLTAFARQGDGSLQEIRLGPDGFAVKLQKLLQINAALARRGEHAARLDLDNKARPEWVAAQLSQP